MLCIGWHQPAGGRGVFGSVLAKAGWRGRGPEGCPRSLLRVVRSSERPAEWISAAIQSLLCESLAERVGVWLEDRTRDADGASAPVFRGEVREKETGNGPPEWTRLSASAPLPLELLSSGTSFECAIDGPQTGPITGPLIDLCRVLWVPVTKRSVLRGMILVGTRQKKGLLPRLHAENVAAELGALLELEEERRLAQWRKADLELWSRVRSLLNEKQNGGMILAQLAESCTRGTANGGVGAVFALIGEKQRGRHPDSSDHDDLNVRAQSGDSEWSHRVNSEPLRALWRQALEAGRPCGSDMGDVAFAKEIGRIVGLPLRWGDAVGGVLLAGLPKAKTNLGSLERLELRAQLAAEVLGREFGEQREEEREAAVQRAFELKMAQAEKLASLGQRVTGIMHDLSNPLTTILGHAQRMLSRENGDAPSPEVYQIREQAERASSILRQLLSLSRETKPERRVISLNDLVERTIELHRATLNGTTLQIRTDTEEHLPPIEGDYGRLQQVLINLLQNAQHAVELSGIGDTVGVRTSSGGGSRVRLEVWDNGPGIPSDLRQRIFDPFFTTKPPGIGTGLGLAIVSAIVQQHGGSIALDCPGEGGAGFIVDLPAARPDSAAESESQRLVPFRAVSCPARRSDANSVPMTRSGPPRRILVVEDEPTVANLIADVLRDEGMHVDVLADGRAALEAVQRCAYDLTVCDLQMPGMDGPTLYSKLVQGQNPARERFLCVTGDVAAGRTHEFLQKYGLPHLAKPFRVEELTVAVREMLSGNRRAAVP